MTSSGHIYKIICTLDEKFCYIGSTFNRLSKRFEGHRMQYNKWKKGDVKTFSCFPYFDKYGVENFKIILIKTYEVCRSHVKDHRHLDAYETLWINKTKCVNKMVAFNPLNKHKRHRSIKAKISYNPEKAKSQGKAYRAANPDKVKARHKHYNDKNRDKIKLKRKEYNDKNRDKIYAKQKEYYAKYTRDEINERARANYAKRQAKKKAEKEAQNSE